MKEFTITELNEKQRLNKYLLRMLPNAGSGFIYKMLRKKNIVLNGKKADGSELLNKGDVIKIFFSDETFLKLSGEAVEIKYPILDPELIVYEDDNVLIINKPAGMLSQKAEKDDVSACEYLIGYLMKYKGFTQDSFKDYKPSAVNRLDRNTTGLLVCAKNLRAASELSECFKERTLTKEYLTIVKGKVLKNEDLKGYLVKDEKTNKVYIDKDNKNGSFIDTSYTPIKFCDTINSTVLMVDLKTGKTHQIRAHLASNNMPIAGDGKYGDRKWNEKLKSDHKIKYQLLHSYRITFPKFDGVLKGISDKVISVEPPFKYLYED